MSSVFFFSFVSIFHDHSRLIMFFSGERWGMDMARLATQSAPAIFRALLNPIQTGLFLLPRTGGGGPGGPTPVTLQPLIV